MAAKEQEELTAIGSPDENDKKPSKDPNKKPKKRIYSQRQRNMMSGYLFISPFYLLFAVFGIFPILFSFYLGFFSWDGLGPMEFVGLNNFNIIFNDPLFWKSIYNTIMIGLMGTAPQLIAAILIAFALNSLLIRMKTVFRLAIFLPYVTSIVAVAIVFSVIFSNQESGLVNQAITFFGGDPVTWTRSEWGTKIAISVMVFWRWVGYNTLIYLAGMQSIPNDLYEAARIDGASLRQQIQYITIPMLKPFILFTVFTATIGALQLFAEPQIFQGGARPEGMTVVLYLYRDAFGSNAFGTASAAALVLFFIVIIFSSMNMYFTNKIGRSSKVGVKK
ncbi:carbohydrate ABC transporter membrane protein 1 (CUT1 family) [Salisediminibacterium halotolerans]|nr:carbohydrate ABC transporter membrane protein 1 (CUT1 family) [Actinophytocola xinjiangensis]RPE88364.1 carbohydrate ABC transporter membrane protein 1 (CUT1 family) [Salisediminibacterium halotolerans]TWG37273.1 carbohydrate ABC transporter membrane protein 1 (CUT1 family) [Salisediminibacterium halotolerans]GEL08324.1 cytochrome c biogenesis protein [Salisediminibacterium halotolerans]